MFINEVTVCGNMTRDPELKALPSGTKVVTFSVAVNRKWKDRDGNAQEEVEFVNVTFFGDTCDNLVKYFHKGKNIWVRGRMQTRSWDDQDSGKKMYRTEVIGERWMFGTSPRNEDGANQTPPPAAQASEGVDYPEEDIDPNDIPF